MSWLIRASRNFPAIMDITARLRGFPTPRPRVRATSSREAQEWDNGERGPLLMVRLIHLPL